jgi:tetratricopeptide (TPR) repeat protein
LTLEPRLFDAFAYLCEARRLKRDLANAVADCDAALAIRPNVPFVLNERAAALNAAGRVEAAREGFDRTIGIDPDNLYARRMRGTIRYNLGDFAGAAEDYGRAVALDPKSATYLGYQGDALVKLGRTAEAKAAWEAALRLQADNPSAKSGLDMLLKTAPKP